MDLLDRITEYRMLLARRVLRLPLADEARVRLSELEHGLRAAEGAGSFELRKHSRIPARVAATLRLPHRKQGAHVTIKDLGGGGAALLGVPPLTVGGAAVLVVDDLDAGKAYQLPARIAWTSPHAAGVAFAGPPVLLRRHESYERQAA